MGKMVLIGGVTPPLTLDLIDKEIIRLTKKENPKILYVPTAGGDDLSYCTFFKSIYEGKFGCAVDILFLIRENPTEKEIRKKVFSSDVIYIEGGSISRLMSNFKKYGIDKMLEEAYKKEIVLAGKSAGAICFGRYYFESGDLEDFEVDGFNDYKEVDCLNLLDFTVCPHYNAEGYVEKMKEMVKVCNAVGIGIDNNCAIEIANDNYRVIATIDSANAYTVYQDGTKIRKETIIKDQNFKSIGELIKTSGK